MLTPEEMEKNPEKENEKVQPVLDAPTPDTVSIIVWDLDITKVHGIRDRVIELDGISKIDRISQILFQSKNISEDKFRKLIAYFIVTGYQPFSTVEDIGFQLLIQTLRPDLTIPSADTMARVIRREFDNVRDRVSHSLSSLDSKVNNYFSNSESM